MNLLPCFQQLRLADFFMAGAVDDQVVVAVYPGVAVVMHRMVVVIVDLADAVVVHLEVAVVSYLFGAVVKGEQLQVFLGVEPDLLFPASSSKRSSLKPSALWLWVRSTVRVLCSGSGYGAVFTAW